MIPAAFNPHATHQKKKKEKLKMGRNWAESRDDPHCAARALLGV